MQIDFTNIDYLLSGNKKQQLAHKVLIGTLIMDRLKKYNPIVVGTIPLEIDTDESDLDIICHYNSQGEFNAVLLSNFVRCKGFQVKNFERQGMLSILATFELGGFKFEIFAQPIPSKEQWGYRHMMIEYKLLIENGPEFKEQVRKLKKQGMKTEPAFAQLLGLEGDPYIALLNLAI